jgi:Ca-activated chloride channel family protein
MIEIENKGYLYLLLVLPLLAGLFLYMLYWQRKKRAEFGSMSLLNRLVPNRSGTKVLLKAALVLLAVAALAIALANPVKGTRAETVKREGIDIVFAIDVSRSMLAEDVAPNRLEKAKQIAGQVINILGTDRVGIIGYAGKAYPVLPITSDFGMAKMYLQSMNTNMVSSQGTAISEAIKLSSSFFDNPKTSKVLVLISDGEDHDKDAEKAALEAKDAGIRIITVGVGTQEGGPIPLREDSLTRELKRDRNGEVVITKLYPEHLATLAEVTNGEYTEGASTKQVASNIKQTMATIEKSEYEAKTIAGFDAQYQWPAAIAFIFFLLDIFILESKTNWTKKINLFKRKEK